MVIIPEVSIGSSDKKIPKVGFGTAEFPFAESAEVITESIVYAIKLGYRHFDTAAVYNSEKFLGDAIKEALRLGFINSREQLFITSKLWCRDAHPDCVISALKKTLANLKLEYLDLYLIHLPISLIADRQNFPFEKEELVGMDIRFVWEAMEECQRLGLTKSIGVSNFSCKKLQTLLNTATIPPAVNQVEMSPLWQQKKLVDFCREKGVHITAYSPLGAKGTPWGTNQVLENQVLKEIAEAKGKTVAQICLRWVYEQGGSLLIKSFNKERIKQNLDIFEWELSLEELEQISQLPQHKAFDASDFIHENGPFKSPEEFWDGEI